MSTEIIKSAIMFPHLFPWESQLKKRGVILSKQEVKKVLIEKALDDTDVRRVIGWQLDRLIYEIAMKSETIRELFSKIKEEYTKLQLNNCIELEDKLILAICKRKDLYTEENLSLYKKFLNGEMEKQEYATYSKVLFNWAADLLMFYYYSKESNRQKDEAVNFIKEKLSSILFDESCSISEIVSKIDKIGFKSKEISDKFFKSLSCYSKEYKDNRSHSQEL